MESGHRAEIVREHFAMPGFERLDEIINCIFGFALDVFSFENCLGRRRYGDVQPKSSKALHEIVLEMSLVSLLQVVSAEIVVGVAGLQHGVSDDQHGMGDGHHRSLDPSSRCQAPELG